MISLMGEIGPTLFSFFDISSYQHWYQIILKDIFNSRRDYTILLTQATKLDVRVKYCPSFSLYVRIMGVS